jgi:acetyltransferase-like isoleucine patch superfamily enzyme
MNGLARRALRLADTRRAPLTHAFYNARRAWLLARVRVLAAWAHATVDMQIDPTVRLGRGIKLQVFPGTRTTVRIGSAVAIGDGVLLRFKGGSLTVDHGCELRRDVNLSIGGRLVIGRGSILSWATIVHCDEAITIGENGSITEQCTIADSSHFFTEPHVPVHHNLRTAPISIGLGTWLCAKVTVAKGVTIGEHVIVGPNSVVVDDIPSGQFASGVPAVIVGPVDLPWV